MGKIAIIDLGTNTFHLLLAEADEQGCRIFHRAQVVVKIGKGGINQGIITEDGINRALVAMQSFKNTIDRNGGATVYAFGTSALRNAVNAKEVIDRIRELTAIQVDVISGDQEAIYIFEGVKAAVGLGSEHSMVVDIGGGSVEFIIGTHDVVLWKQSLEIGGQRLLEKFHINDPITADELAALDEYFREKLIPVFHALERFPCRVMVGSSGTFDTLSDIFCVRHDIHKTADEIETPLTIEGFYEIYADLIKKNRADRLAIPGMIEMRVDMIVVAVCLVRYLIEHHPFNRIRVSTYSLKEGVLSSIFHQHNILPERGSKPVQAPLL